MVGVYHLIWEDKAKNRDVEIMVRYQVSEGNVEVTKITPTRVWLYEGEQAEVTKVLPVTKEVGQKVLARAFHASQSKLGQSKLGQSGLEHEIQSALAV